MLLLNYDLYDLYAVLTALRAAPQKEYNVQIIQTVLRLLTELQADNTIEDNLVRRGLRAICNLGQELFRWVYTDNVSSRSKSSGIFPGSKNFGGVDPLR